LAAGTSDSWEGAERARVVAGSVRLGKETKVALEVDWRRRGGRDDETATAAAAAAAMVVVVPAAGL
jgi:hypothetical protein